MNEYFFMNEKWKENFKVTSKMCKHTHTQTIVLPLKQLFCNFGTIEVCKQTITNKRGSIHVGFGA
jgi:hypothetical protein